MTPSGDGDDPARRSLGLGFWEAAALRPDGLDIGAWALDPVLGVGPAHFRLEWGGRHFHAAPNRARPDVTGPRGLPAVAVGVATRLPIAFDPHEDLADARLLAEWPDGRETVLPALRPLRETGLLRQLRFTTPQEFEQLFQNPAFRKASPALQAYGAARAMRLAGDDLEFWLAGAVVGLYRHIEHGVFRRHAAAAAVARWKGLQAGLRREAAGAALRWATSMHLAAGYAHLAWGEPALAREEFLAMGDYAPRMESWPQCLTNLGIGCCIGAFLSVRMGDAERARAALDGAEAMFPAGVAPLRIWNLHMFEELKNALRVWQCNFALQRHLAGEAQAHILPPGFGFRLAEVSAPLRLLVARGCLPDWRFPQDAAAE